MAVFLFLIMSDRSLEYEQYKLLYYTKSWASLRQTILARDLYTCQLVGCGVALTSGRDKPNSAVIHHLKPHKGDLELFFDPDNLQSVCWRCHSGKLQSIEALGYDTTIGNDGWPIDPKHPSAK